MRKVGLQNDMVNKTCFISIDYLKKKYGNK